MTQAPLPGSVPEWTIGDRLRKAREDAGFRKNQLEFAQQIGISRRSLTNYELAHTPPPRPVLLAWSFRTGISMEWLMTGEGPGPEGDGLPRLDLNQRPSDYTSIASPVSLTDHSERRRNARATRPRIPLLPRRFQPHHSPAAA